MDDMREKVIRGLECCTAEIPLDNNIHKEDFCNKCPYHDSRSRFICCFAKEDLMHDALSLLKAQEPVEPDVDVDTWICGKCGHKLEHQEMVGSNILFHEQYSYCPNCGTAVKWNG